MHDADVIEGIISEISFISQTNGFQYNKGIITGDILVFFDGLSKPISFSVSIFPQYPLKHHESESIKFISKELIAYNHVMEDGSICIHTSHHINLKQKILIDFNALKLWIEKYYIHDNKDTTYEHIIASECLINETYISYVFTEIDYKFAKEDFGTVKLSNLQTGIYKGKNIENFLVQSFYLKGTSLDCKWSHHYKEVHSQKEGLFYFLETHPAKHDRFILKNWTDFSNLLSEEFLKALHNYEFNNANFLPVFLGYNTVDDEIHWQVAIIEKNKLPLKEEYVQDGMLALPKWKLINSKVNWAISRNSSYKYFYGRGALCSKITENKILVLGVGALGSMIAKSLTRGGIQEISIADYDVKEYENICRSEYMFHFGLGDKVNELGLILSMISPFVNINIINDEYFESAIKIFKEDISARKHFIDTLNEYDIVFDCTTDNDLMYILSDLKLDCDVINLSITNHANELVCAFHPNIYHFVNTQFDSVLNNDVDDLYEPTGCWSPTFKASYTDIDLLVKFAIKHINHLYESGKKKNNFVIESNQGEVFSINVREF